MICRVIEARQRKGGRDAQQCYRDSDFDEREACVS